MRQLLRIFCLTALLIEPAGAVGVVQINGITDLALGSWSIGNPAISSYIDVCIAATGTLPVSDYAITATGNNGFTLASGSNHIPYSLNWEDSGAGNLGTSSPAVLPIKELEEATVPVRPSEPLPQVAAPLLPFQLGL